MLRVAGRRRLGGGALRVEAGRCGKTVSGCGPSDARVGSERSRRYMVIVETAALGVAVIFVAGGLVILGIGRDAVGVALALGFG
jgi:hypothetical protein